MSSRLNPGRHHLDLSKILGQPLDKNSQHKIKYNICKHSCVLKGKIWKYSKSYKSKKIFYRIKFTYKRNQSHNTLSSGNYLLEISSAEMLVKALIVKNLVIGGIQTQVLVPSDIPTYDVIHGVLLDENLEEFRIH